MVVVSVADNHAVNPFGWTCYLQPVEADVDNMPLYICTNHTFNGKYINIHNKPSYVRPYMTIFRCSSAGKF